VFFKPLVEPKTQGKRRGRPWRDTRQVLEGMLWILRTGAPCKKEGRAVGPTRHGKGTKITAIANRRLFPVAADR